jgi:hypothetical protein
MINNAAQTYLLLQSAHNNVPIKHVPPIFNALVGIPLLLILLVVSIGLVLDVVFEWEKAVDYMIKAASILMLIAVIGLIVALFL